MEEPIQPYLNILHNILQDYAISHSKTIEPRDSNLAFLADSAKTLTFYDVMDILDNYKCSGTCHRYELKIRTQISKSSSVGVVFKLLHCGSRVPASDISCFQLAIWLKNR